MTEMIRHLYSFSHFSNSSLQPVAAKLALTVIQVTPPIVQLSEFTILSTDSLVPPCPAQSGAPYPPPCTLLVHISPFELREYSSDSANN